MAIIRNTSSYPTGEVKALMRFATQDVDMRNVCVNVKGGKNWRGYAYEGVPFTSNAPPSARYLITMRLPALLVGSAMTYRGTKRSPLVTIKGWREACVYLAAHEAKHIEQFKENLPRSEVRCEHFSAHMLKRYREARDG